MPWKGVTVSEERQRFLEDYKLSYYSVSDLAERFSICRKTAHTWIDRFEQHGLEGYHELSRRPLSCPWQTEPAVVEELVSLRQAHPHWGPRKLLDLMHQRQPRRDLPAVSTAALILARQGLVRPRRRYRRAHPGCPKSIPQGPNDIWAADYKGQFRLKDGGYCFPLTVSDLASRYVLGVDAHPAISLDRTLQHFTGLFEAYGLPNRIRTDNRSSSLTGWDAVRIERFGAAVAAVGVVHQAGDLPGVDRAWGAAAEWGARADAPDAEAGGDGAAGQQPASSAAEVRSVSGGVQRRAAPRSLGDEEAGAGVPLLHPSHAKVD